MNLSAMRSKMSLLFAAVGAGCLVANLSAAEFNYYSAEGRPMSLTSERIQGMSCEALGQELQRVETTFDDIARRIGAPNAARWRDAAIPALRAFASEVSREVPMPTLDPGNLPPLDEISRAASEVVATNKSNACKAAALQATVKKISGQGGGSILIGKTSYAELLTRFEGVSLPASPNDLSGQWTLVSSVQEGQDNQAKHDPEGIEGGNLRISAQGENISVEVSSIFNMMNFPMGQLPIKKNGESLHFEGASSVFDPRRKGGASLGTYTYDCRLLDPNYLLCRQTNKVTGIDAFQSFKRGKGNNQPGPWSHLNNEDPKTRAPLESCVSKREKYAKCMDTAPSWAPPAGRQSTCGGLREQMEAACK